MEDRSGYVGKEIGSYRIITEISSGSYGAVYQGKHVIFDDEPIVALKLLHAHLASPEEREQFIQEARLLRKLKHPHILPILDAGTRDGMPYLVTEYASGGSLRDRLKQQQGAPLSIEDALTVITQVGQALYYAHQQNVVHRDLKPGNILFNAKGEALLADFGIAVILAMARTRDIGLGGTPAYMAPEQFEGKVSMKSDQYALGCIAYELVTGQRPFVVPNPTIEAMWFQHAKVDPVAPTQYNPRLPIHIEQVILKAMAKQRIERHIDVSAFTAALEKNAQQWLNEGITLLNLKRYEEALAAFEQAIHLDPNLAVAYNRKGAALRGLNRYEEALVACERAIRLDPNYVQAYNAMGLTLHNLNRYEDALAAYKQAIRLDSNYAIAIVYNNMGNTLSELKRYEDALAVYEQAIRLDPNFALAYDNMGNTLGDLKQYEEALAAYEQATCLDPDYALAYYGKCYVLYALKRYEQALAAVEQAIRLDPKLAIAYYSKGHVLEKLERFAEAQQFYKKARELGYNG